MKKRYFIGNLKMYINSPEEGEQFLSVLRRESRGKKWDRTDLVVVAPFPYLERFRRELPSEVFLGAQDVFWEKEGSYTGEVSASMLKNAGVEFVLVGHSERREYAGETDEIVARKAGMLLKSNLRPVLCVGETEDERKRGGIAEVLERQIRGVFDGLAPLQAEKVLVAYEPRWAIGSDRTPTSEEILQAKVIIYRTIASVLGAAVAERVPILYGGSVKAALLPEVCFGAQMDGVLVGRESLFPYEVVRMMSDIDGYEYPVRGRDDEKR